MAGELWRIDALGALSGRQTHVLSIQLSIGLLFLSSLKRGQMS